MEINLSRDCNIFIKAVSNEYADKYFNEGEIYFNTLSYYQELERDDNIGDSMENISIHIPEGVLYFSKEIDISSEEALNKDNYKFSTPAKNIQVAIKNNTDVIHCLCESELDPIQQGREKTFQLKVNSKFIKEYKNQARFFLIYDPEKYLERIKVELKKNKLESVDCFPVKYFSDKEEFVELKGNPFKKRDKYSYQNEYRIYVKKNSTSPLAIKIGSLQNIAIEISYLI